MPYGEREQHHQEVRRGRYVEFNLLYDRGTKYGLQSGRRVESVLASMPSISRWTYHYTPEPGSPEDNIQAIFSSKGLAVMKRLIIMRHAKSA